MTAKISDLGPTGLAPGSSPVAVPLTRIGRYQLITRLAVGGMAEVYLARHGELSGFKTLVVLKKVLSHLAEQPDFINMFLDEARIASLLDHPNVVRIFEVGRAGNEYFLAMELVQGKPLASLIRRAMDRKQPLAPKLAALVVAHAAQGLHHAHGLADAEGRPLNLVHRDVSPQNILISFEGSVKVIDFGIARALGRLTSTSVGGMKGKIGYMSPEQAKSEEVDHRTDIFALGVVLWEALCSKRLFAKETDFATMRSIVYEPIPRPSTIAKIAPALEHIVMKALARDPAARFQSAQEMAAALERYIFQSGGAGTADLAALLKGDFAEDQVRWKNTVRMALDLEDPSEATTMPEMHLSMTGVPLPTPPSPSMIAQAAATPLLRPQPAGPRRLALVAVAAATALLVLGIGLVILGRTIPKAPPAPSVAPAPPPRPAVTPRVEALPAPTPPTTPAPAATDPGGAETAAAAEARRRKAGAPVRRAPPAARPVGSSSTTPATPTTTDRRPNPFE